MPCTLEEWYQWVDQVPSPVLLDGGLGHLLAERGNDLSTGSLWSGRLLLTNPDELSEVARLWLEAGSDVIATATYQVTVEQLQQECILSEQQAEALMFSSVKILNDRRTVFWNTLLQEQRSGRRYPKICASMGPFSAVLPGMDDYSGTYSDVSRSDFRHFHASRCRTLDKLARDPHAIDCDLYCFETIGNMDESIAIVEAMADQARTSVPFWISFQCRDSERIACGERFSRVVENVLRACSSKNLVAIGVNCVNVNSVKRLVDLAKKTTQSYMSTLQEDSWRVDVIAYPNSGEVWGKQGWTWPENFPAHNARSWADVVFTSGARLLGGCCRIGPAEIQALYLKRSEASSVD